MPTKYFHRRVTPKEFSALMHKAGMRLNDFLFFTGRQSLAVGRFLSNQPNAPYTPTMGDVMLLELVARDPSMKDVMLDIANEYSEGGEPPSEYIPTNDKRSA